MAAIEPSRLARQETVYRRYRGAVESYFRRRCPAGEVDDLVSDVFLVCWRRLEDVPAEAELPWLIGVARKTLLAHHRAVARASSLAEAVAANCSRDEACSADDGASGPDRLAMIGAFRRLSASQVDILLLSAWEGLSGPDLAVALGCSRAAARVRLHRARSALEAAYGTGSTGDRGTGRPHKHLIAARSAPTGRAR